MPEEVHVTEILEWVGSEELAHWRGDVGNRAANKIRKEALAIGTKLHTYVATRVHSKETSLPEKPFELKMACVAASNWLDLHRLTQCEVERSVQRDKLVGTVDLLATVDGVREVLDWKTSSRLDWKHEWQVNAYMALTETYSGRLVRLDKNLGVFEEKPMQFSPDMWAAFLGLMDAYSYWRNHHAADTTHREVNTDKSLE